MIEPALLFGGRYELGPVIGQGGMAEVRSGRDTRLDRPVAVKLLRPEMAHQPGVRDRFESEARLAARLNHPNVVAVFDSGEHDGVPYIVMERLPGETLQDRMAGGPLDPGTVRVMAIQVLGALQAAHEAGVLHRDIKPGNILAAPGDRWKVGDFGIAKALEVGRSDLTSTGLLIGTPAYVAPERLLGSPATVASDLYSLGVVLYEALAGRKPFDVGGAHGWAAPVTGPAPALPARPGVDRDLAEAVQRCLARDPADRYWSAAEMEAGLAGGPVRSDRRRAPVGAGPAAADPTALLGRSSPTEVFPQAPRPQARPDASGRGRVGAWFGPRRVGWGLVAAAVAVVVILAVALSGRGSPNPGTAGTTATTATSAPAGSATAAGGPASASGGAATASGGVYSSGTGLPAGLSRALDNLRQQVTGGR